MHLVPGNLARVAGRPGQVSEVGADVAEAVVQGTRAPKEPLVPERTKRRWRPRVATTARVPGQVLATAGSHWLRGVAQAVGLDGDRWALAAAYAERFEGSPLGPMPIS